MAEDLANALISTTIAKAVETSVDGIFELLHTLLDEPFKETGYLFTASAHGAEKA